MCSPTGMPGRILSRGGSSPRWASMSMTTRPAGPQATTTPGDRVRPHHRSMRPPSRVAAWKPWHQRPAGRQGQPLWVWPGVAQSRQFAAGVLRPGARGSTGQPPATHQRASRRPATGRSGVGCPESLRENRSPADISSPSERLKRLKFHLRPARTRQALSLTSGLRSVRAPVPGPSGAVRSGAGAGGRAGRRGGRAA